MKNLIKKALLLSGSVALVGILATGIFNSNVVQAYNSNPIQERSTADSHAEFMDVFNEDNVAHEVGDVVVWSSTATSGTTGLSISTTTTEADQTVAGVIVENDIAATSWGKIQTRGYNAAVNITGNCVVGGQLVTSSTGELGLSSAAVQSATQASGAFGVSLVADTDGSCRAILK